MCHVREEREEMSMEDERRKMLKASDTARKEVGLRGKDGEKRVPNHPPPSLSLCRSFNSKTFYK